LRNPSITAEAEDMVPLITHDIIDFQLAAKKNPVISKLNDNFMCVLRMTTDEEISLQLPRQQFHSGQGKGQGKGVFNIASNTDFPSLSSLSAQLF
jgi:hypothetical protein